MAKKTEASATPTREDIVKELEAKQVDLLESKRSHAAGDLLNPRVITSARREIARLKTKLRQLDIAAKESK